MGLAYMFSDSAACLFNLLTGSFAEQKFFILMRSNLLIFFLLWIMLLVSSLRTLCLALDLEDFLLLFFKFYSFTFKSMTHLS